MVPNSLHARLLKLASPGGRRAKDVFPTVYRMNTLGAIARLFPGPAFRDASFIFNGQPAYHFGSVAIAKFWLVLMALMPNRMGQSLFAFVQKT